MGSRSDISALTVTQSVPVRGLCKAVIVLPYSVVTPYSNVTMVLELLGLIYPSNNAEVDAIFLALLVVPDGP